MAQRIAHRAACAALLTAVLSLTACSASSNLANESFNPDSASPSPSVTASTPTAAPTLPAVPVSGPPIGAPTHTTLSGPGSSVVAGTKVVLKATVRAQRGLSIPVGTATFVDGTKVLATVALVPGRASASSTVTVQLPAGTNVLVARYGGDKVDAPSLSGPLTVTAVKSVTTVSLTFKAKANHRGRFRVAIDVKGQKPGPAGSGVVYVYVDGARLVAGLDALGHTFVDVRLRIGSYHTVVVTYAGNTQLTAARTSRSVRA